MKAQRERTIARKLSAPCRVPLTEDQLDLVAGGTWSQAHFTDGGGYDLGRED